jgi:hypothetical protein
MGGVYVNETCWLRVRWPLVVPNSVSEGVRGPP